MAVGAEDGAKGAVLEPARVEFLVGGLVGLASEQRMVAADVRGPVGIAGEREVEARRHLAAQRPPAAVHIARPHRGAVALLAHEGRAGEQEDALLRIGLLPALLDVAGVQQGKDVGVFEAAADVELFIAQDGVADVRPCLFGLGAVEPEGVPPLGEELADKLIPEKVRGGGVGGIVDLRAGNIEALLRRSA